MKIKINGFSLFVFIILFLIEVGIAIFIKDQFIRPFVGDVLVIILVFSFVRIFYQPRSDIPLIIGVFLFAVLVEIGQSIHIVKVLNLQNSAIFSTIIGNTFDWCDILAYAIGSGFLFLIPTQFWFRVKSKQILS